MRITCQIKIGDAVIQAAKSVKNIGATFDEYMKMEQQVKLTCKSAWYNLYGISKLKKYLTHDQMKSVVQALVIARIDQNNSLLIGSPNCLYVVF